MGSATLFLPYRGTPWYSKLGTPNLVLQTWYSKLGTLKATPKTFGPNEVWSATFGPNEVWSATFGPNEVWSATAGTALGPNVVLLGKALGPNVVLLGTLSLPIGFR